MDHLLSKEKRMIEDDAKREVMFRKYCLVLSDTQVLLKRDH